jgi:hypothetical protein
MVLQDDTPIYTEGHTQASVLMHAALSAKWNEPPRGKYSFPKALACLI